MKLTKLSLAAVLAAGSFSFANAAVSVEDAIKDVEIGGMLRYRGEGERIETKKDGNKTIEATNDNKFRVRVDTKVTFDEYFSGNFGVQFDTADTNKADGSNLDTGKVKVKQVNITYNNKDIATTLIGGRQEVTNLYLNGVLADGISVANESIPGVKVSAFYLANLDNGDRYVAKEGPLADKNGRMVDPYQQVYGLGVEGSFDIVNFGLWAAQSFEFATFVGLDANFNLEVAENMKAGIVAQVSQTIMDSKFEYKKDTYEKGFENALSYNANLNFDAGFVNAKVGYASAGKKDADSIVTLHDSGSFDKVGEILMEFNKVEGQAQYIYAGIGAKLDAFSAGFEYVNMTQEVKGKSDKVKANEFVGRLGYKYSKKLSFGGYYAFAKAEHAEFQPKNDVEATKFRVEAKYAF